MRQGGRHVIYGTVGTRVTLLKARHDVRGISGDVLRDHLIPLAPLPEQRRIVERIDALFAEIAEGEAALAEARKGLDLFRRSLLKAAVTGELTRDWRARNPATETGHELLARIKKGGIRTARAGGRTPRAPASTTRDSGLAPSIPNVWALATLAEISSLVTDGDHNPPKRSPTGISAYYCAKCEKWKNKTGLLQLRLRRRLHSNVGTIYTSGQ